ncbi:hypothetical protein A4A49_57790, partial [Nicotiana attenuata]
LTTQKHSPSTQRWQRSETRNDQKLSTNFEESKNTLDNRKSVGDTLITPCRYPTAQNQKVDNIVPKDSRHQHHNENPFSCLYPKDLATTNLETINSPHNSHNPLDNNSHKIKAYNDSPLVPATVPSIDKNKTQSMDLDPKIPTKSQSPSLMQNLGSPQTTPSNLPMRASKLIQQIPSTNQPHSISTSSHNTINVQDILTPRMDKTLGAHIDPYTVTTDINNYLPNSRDSNFTTDSNLSKNKIHDAKATFQPQHEVPKAKEKCLDEATNPTTTPNTPDFHYKTNTTGPCPPILAGMGPHGTCSQRKSSTRKEGPNNPNRRPFIPSSDCDGRDATKLEQRHDPSMVEPPTAHANEHGSPPLSMEFLCMEPTVHVQHAQSKHSHVPVPCNPSNHTSHHPNYPSPAILPTQQQHPHNSTAQNNTTLNPSSMEPNTNDISNPKKSKPKCDGRGGRRGRNSNRKNSGARSVKIPKNNGIPSKKRKKVHLKLPSGFEEMLHLHQEGESPKHLPTCGGVSTNNVHPLLDTTGKHEE